MYLLVMVRFAKDSLVIILLIMAVLIQVPRYTAEPSPVFTMVTVYNGVPLMCATLRSALGGLEESRGELFTSPWEIACFTALVSVHLSMYH